jgi:DNA-binding transcriptional MerR regulator
MSASVPIGEFSRLTHLTVKTLHHYHDIGLLAPDQVDPSSGYRRYATSQVGTALLIRRLRELEMPLPQVREVVEAPSVEARNRVLQEHLARMEAELVRTQQVVGSLRDLLALATDRLAVEYRTLAPLRVVAITDRVEREAIGPWCETAFGTLYDAAGQVVAGPGGASYADEFFTHDAGEVVAFVPVSADTVPGLQVTELPGGEFAIAVHEGPFTDFDRTYAALGSHVAEHCAVAPGPIREIYLTGPGETVDPAAFRTEVCWPILARTA